MSVSNEPGATCRPCLVVAFRDAGQANEACRRFRRQGWDVYQAHNGPELRRLTRMLEPDLVVLDVNLDAESGFLTCAKLTGERPGTRIVLVSEDTSPQHGSMAHFAGAAALMRHQDCLRTLGDTSPMTTRSAAG
jgi:DNA-binding NarL/FixJ family response regulator